MRKKTEIPPQPAVYKPQSKKKRFNEFAITAIATALSLILSASSCKKTTNLVSAIVSAEVEADNTVRLLLADRLMQAEQASWSFRAANATKAAGAICFEDLQIKGFTDSERIITCSIMMGEAAVMAKNAIKSGEAFSPAQRSVVRLAAALAIVKQNLTPREARLSYLSGIHLDPESAAMLRTLPSPLPEDDAAESSFDIAWKNTLDPVERMIVDSKQPVVNRLRILTGIFDWQLAGWGWKPDVTMSLRAKYGYSFVRITGVGMDGPEVDRYRVNNPMRSGTILLTGQLPVVTSEAELERYSGK